MITMNTNLASLIAQKSLKNSTSSLNQAIERMTTGYKINHAKDNAANYSISNNMTTKIGSYQVAGENTAMGMDMVTTACDTISLMQDKAERLHSLAIQARNGTYGATSLAAINQEVSAILSEIDRIYGTAEYNGVSLFSGEKTDAVANASATPEVATFALTRGATPEGSFIADPITYTDEQLETMLANGELVVLDSDTATLSADVDYLIMDKAGLQQLANLVNNNIDTSGITFILGADIDLSGENWTPIGNCSANPNYQFKGVFDGNGHVVKNLNIESEADSQGLFGSAANGSEIKNVGLVGGSVKGKNFVGNLVGNADNSTISNSYATGTATGTGDNVGNLVGFTSSSTISNSYATGTVSGSSGVGGLVGVGDSSISNSYSTGNVTGTGDSVGGLTGDAGGSISNSYATGTATGTANLVGGLIGAGSGTITNCASVQSDSYATQMTEEEILSASNLESMGFTEAEGWTIVNGMPTIATPYATNSKPESDTLADGAGVLLQIGINADSSCQIGFDTRFTYDLSAVGADIRSNEALTAITNFVNLLSEKQTELGAVQNRLESALESIEVNINNLTSSRSTLRDADIAEVSSTYIQQQILQQAAATLLATANQTPSIALGLI